MIRQHLDHARRLGGVRHYLWLKLNLSFGRREYVWSQVDPIYLMYVNEHEIEVYDLDLNPALIALGFAECAYCKHCDLDVSAHEICLRELDPDTQWQHLTGGIMEIAETPRHRYRLVELDYANTLAFEGGEQGSLSDLVSTESRRVIWRHELTEAEAIAYAEDTADELEPPNTGDLLQGETAYRLEVLENGKWVFAHSVTVPAEEDYDVCMEGEFDPELRSAD